MPVSTQTANLYLQLGVSGATLLILLVVMILLFRNIGGNQSSINRLIERIDALIESNTYYTTKLNEVLLSTSKDNESTTNTLNNIQKIVIDVKSHVIRIDERTIALLPKDIPKTKNDDN